MFRWAPRVSLEAECQLDTVQTRKMETVIVSIVLEIEIDAN